MRRALADNLRLDNADIPWSPPAVMPATADLREAIASLKEMLAPSPRGHIQFCLEKLIVAFEPGLKMDAEKARLRLETWCEANSDIPVDLWGRATIEALRTRKFMPRPAEIRELISVRLIERVNFLARAERMLSVSGPKDAPFIEDPEDVKLRTILKWKKAAHKWKEAAPLELRLAMLENREPESWALEKSWPAPSAISPDAPVLPPLSKEMQAATIRAAANHHERDGRKDYAAVLRRQADQLHPAPEYTAIPEGYAHE